MLLIDDETVDVQTLKSPMRIHVVRPKDATRKYPAIIWYSEIFQITGPIKRTAQVLAGHGFIVAMPEVYHEFLPPGKALQYNKEDTALGNEYKAAKEMASWDSDAASTVAFLRAYEHCTGNIAVAGVCLGGGLAFRAAIVCPEVRALICWYPTDLHKGGAPTGDALARAASGGLAHVESLLFFGRQDPHIPGEGRRAVHDALEAGGSSFQYVEVNGQHAFLRDENSYGRYDPELALITYDWAVKVLNRCLKV